MNKRELLVLFNNILMDLRDIRDDLLIDSKRSRGFDYYNYFNRAKGVNLSIKYIEDTIHLIEIGDIECDE